MRKKILSKVLAFSISVAMVWTLTSSSLWATEISQENEIQMVESDDIIQQVGNDVIQDSEEGIDEIATQSRIGNFSRNYSLTGNGVDDIVNVARAQLGKTGSQLGYSEQWCADFVSDCAELANQSSAIPRDGYCPTLQTKIKNAGGDYIDINSVRKGDIVFYGNNGSNHVEIVYAASNGKISTIGGNSGSGSSLYVRSVKDHATQTQAITRVMRPNYKGSVITQKPSIWTDKSTYKKGDTAKISWNSVPNATWYWLVIWHGGKQIVTQGVSGNSSYTLSNLTDGEYTIFVKAANDISEQEVSYSFIPQQNVTEKVEIKMDKSTYKKGDTAKISWNSVPNATWYWLVIWHGGKQIVTQGVSGNSSYTLSNLTDGEYAIFVKAANDISEQEASYSFIPQQNVTEKVEIKMDKSTYKKGDTAKISWNSVPNATWYWLVIWHGGKQIVTQGVSGNSSYTLSNLTDGEYTIFVKAANDISEQQARYDFVIEEEHMHSYDFWKTTKEATCNETGTKTRTCSICGNKEIQIIAKTNSHSYTRKIVKPTCTKKGYTLYSCKTCSNSYKDNETKALGHKIVIEKRVEPTQTKTGLTEGSYCEICKEIIKKQEIIPVIKTETKISVSTKKGIIGKEVIVPVSITKNSGIAGFSFDVNYDSKVLTLKSVNKSELTSKGIFSTNGNIVNWYADENVKENGELFTLVFEIAKNAEVSSTKVGISLHDGKKNLTDETGKYIEAEYLSGEVQITKGVLGDVNGDGDITIGDVVLLNRHVLGKETLKEETAKLADINGDGDITIGDVVKLNRLVLGKIDTLASEHIQKLDSDTVAAQTEISLDDVIVEPEKKFSVPVRIKNNTGIAGLALEISLPDGVKLEFITAGNMLSYGEFSTNGNICTWYTTDNVKEDGVLLQLNLIAGKDIKEGKISVNLKDNKKGNLSDENGNPVLVQLKTGNIIIRENHEHIYVEGKITKANLTQNGKSEGDCSICGEKSENIIYYPKTIKLSKTVYSYDGKTKTPSVKVIDANGKEIEKTNYKVTYPSGRKDVGTYKVKITFIGKYYEGTITRSFKVEKGNQIITGSNYTKTLGNASFTLNAKRTVGDGKLSYKSSSTFVATISSTGKVTIRGVGKTTITIKAAATKKYKEKSYQVTVTVNPKSMSLSTVKSTSSGKITATWKKNTVVTGYEIQYGTKSSFSGAKTATITSYKTVSKTLTGLAKGKKYYVRIRCYNTVSGVKYYSGWSSSKNITVKK